ncbi:RNA-directed DNA polymerase [Rhodovulum sulfidophilum]|uniref:antiviral reverse transcriptase Drt3b n=1 Tax=Rhodovulum sulfidophilum TaxID=35806 RepID=UPI0019246B7E|nr:antiviral reverse transcriptase Drt3b [Rhodovulum sulfidophilum]MBL3576180.1 RNA-directed DNA polymerase [Rhodovulum sulfidophilum]MCE8433469.1 RNA-directed DNA polymerase [Rhodovulum sulfidophilum]MCF4119008.1 RNA-directed DNA polymerase [Rhodovulum sulfidophilum]
MTKPKAIIVQKGDWKRGLLSETTPAEIPILISNDGFYLNLRCGNFPHLLSVLVDSFVKPAETKRPTVPFNYKISKDEDSLRRLSLPHPRSQLEVIAFYEKYHPLITYYCNRGNFSIRRPYKLASHYYLDGGDQNAFAYRTQTIEIAGKDKYAKHPVSVFSYRSFRRLYQFFESSKFRDLEMKYSFMASLDVSRCFDSIYTHSIAWATKSKLEAKRATTVETFGGAFDRLMQQMNHNETNGIIIGPEVSRIFAEVIFDRIDIEVESTLRLASTKAGREGYVRGKHYDIFRYVDNIYIFYNGDRVRRDVTCAIEKFLDDYKMGLNRGKSDIKKRPFFTKKSMAISEARSIRDTYFDAVIETVWLNGHRASGVKLECGAPPTLQDFSNSLRRACFLADSDYSSMAGFLIATLRSRMQRVLTGREEFEAHLTVNDQASAADKKSLYQRKLASYISSCLDMCMHMYTLAPSVQSSLDVATILVLSAEALEEMDVDHFLNMQERLQLWVSKLMRSSAIVALMENDSVVPIEVLNVLCALTAFNYNARHIEDIISNSIAFHEKSNYFEAITIIFVLSRAGGSEGAIREAFLAAKNTILKNVDLGSCSETAHMFLDLLSCPHVARVERRKLYRSVVESFNKVMQGPEQSSPSLPNKATNAEIDEMLEHMEKNPWFVEWGKIDLLRLIEKKRLRSGYS